MTFVSKVISDLIQKAMGFLAYSNLVVALAAASFVGVWQIQYELPISRYAYLLGLLCLSAYGYMHLAESKKPHRGHPVRIFTQKNRGFVFLLTLVSAVLAVYFVWPDIERTSIALLPSLLISIAYPNNRWFKGIRSKPGLKLLFIAFTWAYSSTLVPLWLYSDLPVEVLVTSFFQVFFWVFALAIAFDVRDIAFDGGELQTLPQQKGILLALRWAWIAIAAVEVSLFIQFMHDQFSWGVLFARWIPLELSSLFLWRLRRKSDPLFISFWIEALPIIGLILLFFSSKFFFN